MTDADRLESHGWTQTRTGRWIHPGLTPVHGRRRPFTTAQALTLADALSNPMQEVETHAVPNE